MKSDDAWRKRTKRRGALHQLWISAVMRMREYDGWDHLYYILFFLFSLAGVCTHGYFFCFHLLHVVRASTILRDVLKSVTRNGVTLLFVFGLGAIVIYIFSVHLPCTGTITSRRHTAAASRSALCRS